MSIFNTHQLLFQMRFLFFFFCGDAILTTCYLINSMPTRVLKYDTPFKILEQTFPTLKHLFSSLHPGIFGCTSYVHDHNSTKSKLDPHALKCVFLGCSPSKKGYMCYDPPSKKYLVSLNVTFAENQPYYQHTLMGGKFR